LLVRLAGLRRATVGMRRAPHKPLLLLWLFGRFATTGTSVTTYEEAEEPVSNLINEFGPAVANRSAARQRAAMPFVHLERELWQLTDMTGQGIGPEAPERGGWLRERQAVGRLRPEVERLLARPSTLAAAVRLLLDQHFTPTLGDIIWSAVDLDLPEIESAAAAHETPPARRRRQNGFTEEVLRAYAYACAVCGFDGRLGRHPVAIQAAHVRWHSQDGPDEVANALALCVLHHALLDLGVLGLTEDLRVRVSTLYVANSEAGRAVDDLAGRPLLTPRPGQPSVKAEYVTWHERQVFKGSRATAA
jgi:putative restriction endonuclease